MKDQLLQEKAEIEERISDRNKTIENYQNLIHWDKKRLRLVEAQLKEMENGLNPDISQPEHSEKVNNQD